MVHLRRRRIDSDIGRPSSRACESARQKGVGAIPKVCEVAIQHQTGHAFPVVDKDIAAI
jgi:hypothetical protein